MLCKNCGETFSDGYKACPHCGEKKTQKKSIKKIVKVDLPDDIKPEMPADNFISSKSKPAPHIEKVIVNHEAIIKNKARNTRYIDKDTEEVLRNTNDSSEKQIDKPESPKKPVSTNELFSKSLTENKPAQKRNFKINLPEEYAQLNLKVDPTQAPEAKSYKVKQSAMKIELEDSSEAKANLNQKAENQETKVDNLEAKKHELQQNQLNHDFEMALQSKRTNSNKKSKILPTKAKNAIVAMVMVLVISMCSLTAISATTSWFEMSDEVIKTLSFISVKDEEVEEVESFLNKILPILISEDFASSNISANDMLNLIEPFSDSGVYSSFFGSASLIYDNDDPAKFFIEEGEGYYCIAQEQIDEILNYLGVDSISMAMQEEYYLYNGYYYFSEAPEDYTQVNYDLVVNSVQSTLDGCYYVQLTVNDLENLISYKRYIILSPNDSDDGATFFLDTISETTLFNSFGEMRLSDDEETTSYTIEREVIELETSDGIVIYEYVFDYPVFSGESNTELLINQLYLDLIDSYNLTTQEVDNEYEVYQLAGIDESIYPISVYIDISVQYYDDETISILQHTIEENSLIEEQEDLIVPIYKTSLSSIIYELDSSHEIKLSSLVGEDEDAVCEILYRLYYGYDYSTVLSGEYLDKPSWYYYGWEDDYDSTPEDELGIGEAIYNSCYVLTEAGVVFYYANDYGYFEELLLDNDTITTLLAIADADDSEITE